MLNQNDLIKNACDLIQLLRIPKLKSDSNSNSFAIRSIKRFQVGFYELEFGWSAECGHVHWRSSLSRLAKVCAKLNSRSPGRAVRTSDFGPTTFGVSSRKM